MMKAPVLALLMLSLTACANLHSPHHSSATVGHVVICWLKEPGNEAQRQQIIDRSNDAEADPRRSEPAHRPGNAIHPAGRGFELRCGTRRPVQGRGSLHAYETNPLHLKAVREVIAPLTAKRLIYDIDLAPQK